MEASSKPLLSEAEKDRFISALTPELVLLRTKAEISQEDLSMLIGVSRQTYGAIERKIRKMSWSTYLSLILFYDYNRKTHEMIRSIGVFPHDMIKRFNEGSEPKAFDIEIFFSNGGQNIVDKLDDQALRSIRTMIMLEYARCTGTPGDVIVKAFDGVSFSAPSQSDNKKAAKALKAIKERRKKNG